MRARSPPRPATLCSIDSRDARSIFTGRTSRAPPAPVAIASNSSGLRVPQSRSSSGSCASASATARPMPRLEPVTRAVRAERSM